MTLVSSLVYLKNWTIWKDENLHLNIIQALVLRNISKPVDVKMPSIVLHLARSYECSKVHEMNHALHAVGMCGRGYVVVTFLTKAYANVAADGILLIPYRQGIIHVRFISTPFFTRWKDLVFVCVHGGTQQRGGCKNLTLVGLSCIRYHSTVSTMPRCCATLPLALAFLKSAPEAHSA